MIKYISKKKMTPSVSFEGHMIRRREIVVHYIKYILFRQLCRTLNKRNAMNINFQCNVNSDLLIYSIAT